MDKLLWYSKAVAIFNLSLSFYLTAHHFSELWDQRHSLTDHTPYISYIKHTNFSVEWSCCSVYIFFPPTTFMYQNELNWYDAKLRILHQPELAEFTVKHYLFSAESESQSSAQQFHLTSTTWLRCYFLKTLHFLRITVIKKEISIQLCPLEHWSQYNTGSNQLFITWNTLPRYQKKKKAIKSTSQLHLISQYPKYSI